VSVTQERLFFYPAFPVHLFQWNFFGLFDIILVVQNMDAFKKTGQSINVLLLNRAGLEEKSHK